MASILVNSRSATINKCSLLIEHFCTPLLTRFKATSVKQTPAEYCLDLVRKYDYENYLCALLLPNTVRSAALAIRAFNIEVARVEEQASDTTIGKMRLKFWEDTVDKIYNDTPPRNPVALELHRIVRKHKLSKHYLKRLIVARSEKLTLSVFPSLESLEAYAENTASPVYYLLLEASDIKHVRVDHAASHLGKAHGITNLIRSILYNAQRRSIVIPQDIMMKHNLSTEEVLRGKSRKEIGDAVFDVSSRAKLHLEKARSLRNDVPKKASAIFLPAITIDFYLERLRRVDFDIYHPSLQHRSALLPIILFWKKLRSLPY
ncbi:NADH dehydrogenase (ubiquinone) complex I, assembly factor 6 [Neodiprion fabricii]|uniref:NADH dehydrogenase (ubiquinone) complex I, assembly factor 6 n=1 Tax=Neodiprion fabricii TaxID=2872261 RepID=UPI001ED977E4|nr:NADH dehydrogenase (ubiquinone) complex I, assembly factor 6 [Neodiprion fabricii]